jgi:hypothetical protein
MSRSLCRGYILGFGSWLKVSGGGPAMGRIRFRLRTMMIVVAFAALVLTVVIQNDLLRRASVAHQESAAVQQQIAVAGQHAAALVQEIERQESEAKGRVNDWARAMAEHEKTLRSVEDDSAIEGERTRGGFKRSIRKLSPPANVKDLQGSEND